MATTQEAAPPEVPTARRGLFGHRRLTDEEKREAFFTATQWRLMWLKFRSHRWALWGLLVISVFYFVAIFAGFFATNDPVTRRPEYQYLPPSILGKARSFRLFDQEGSFRPVVYPVRTKLNLQTFEQDVFPDLENERPLRLFARGDPYSLFFIIESDIHLFGSGDPEVRWFPLGTDGSGRCLYSRMVHGATLSLSIGILAIAISWVLGVLIGGISGYFGGIVDNVIQRIIEVLMSFPTLPLWIALSAALPLHWTVVQVYFAITLILSVLGWTGLARVVRSKLLAVREEEFVLAATLDGCRRPRLVARHMLPAFASHLIVVASNQVPGMILGETALSFIGVGLRAPAVSWGVLLREAQNVQSVALRPWLLLPALLVVFTVVAFQFLGDGLRDAMDPYR